ncbi:hypothetical protein H2199_008897 [Coniosporium tulheliwenetii]|uniref:Uncharacterized protein n=1 Tax=Coniosporium tulheliwenetii TaxID=3383036 RepID=A0ACC2YH26_9PEZI|nr:hypothetical protein H2199_008897 [Cladosporium sp. JES 115]
MDSEFHERAESLRPDQFLKPNRYCALALQRSLEHRRVPQRPPPAPPASWGTMAPPPDLGSYDHTIDARLQSPSILTKRSHGGYDTAIQVTRDSPAFSSPSQSPEISLDGGLVAAVWPLGKGGGEDVVL